MSLPASSNSANGDSDTTLVTAMIAIAATVLVVATVWLSIGLKRDYDKLPWEFGSTAEDK